MNLLKYLQARMREPSTIAAVGVLATIAGVPPGTIDLAAQIVASACSLVAIIKPDTKPDSNA